TMMQFKNTLSLLVLFIFGISGLWAQPTLNNTVFPDIGELITVAEATDSNAVGEGVAGANITWNFSNLVAASGTSYTTNFQTSAGTPYEPLFPTSNICGVNFDPEAVYGYYQKTSTEFNVLGVATMDFAIEYSNPETVMKAPLSFNGNYSDVFWGGIDAGGGFLLNIYGERESQYDAYGTLILPIGTYNNAMRVKSIVVNRDTTDFGGLMNISNTTTTNYEWYVASQPGPLVTISYYEGTNVSIVPGFPPDVEVIPLSKSINFTTDVLTGVAEVPTFEGNLAFRGANPVADVLALDIETATAGETLQLQVYSRNGQLVSTQNITSNGAVLSVDINVANCTPGLYFVSITDGNARLSKGFVKM
ncbi:MAG: T9SS type A sorting domain-containing protein, partial [Saprospiraceae bacterium]|nr:T9SS type A sorting domain-containing protein [Saprospiraceae bacterium]